MSEWVTLLSRYGTCCVLVKYNDPNGEFGHPIVTTLVGQFRTWDFRLTFHLFLFLTFLSFVASCWCCIFCRFILFRVPGFGICWDVHPLVPHGFQHRLGPGLGRLLLPLFVCMLMYFNKLSCALRINDSAGQNSSHPTHVNNKTKPKSIAVMKVMKTLNWSSNQFQIT